MKGDALETGLSTLMAELVALQIGYAQTVVAFLDEHPDIAAAYKASVECADRIAWEDRNHETQVNSLGTYMVAFREFLYPQGCSHGQWILGMRRVNNYLKRGSYLEEWEVQS